MMEAFDNDFDSFLLECKLSIVNSGDAMSEGSNKANASKCVEEPGDEW